MQRTPDSHQPGAAALISQEELAQFYLEPEHLENDEISYELRVRGIDASGQRRELTARLRQVLLDEKRELKQFPRLTVGQPNTELNLAQQHVSSLRATLFSVNNDPITQQKFMSQFIHWEARLNRIQTVGVAPDVTDKVFALNEEYIELYQEFVRHLNGLKRSRKEAPEVANGVPVAQMGVNGVFNMDQPQAEAVHEQSEARGMPLQRPHSPGTKRASLPNYDEIYRLPTGNTPRNSSTDFGILGQMIGAQCRQPTSSQRHDLSGYPRLSSNFRPSGGRAITPIGEGNANNVQQEVNVMRRSISAAADEDSIVRRDDSAAGVNEFGMRRNRSATTENNSNLRREQSYNPPPSPSQHFGEDRRNSMPYPDGQVITNRHTFERNGFSVGNANDSVRDLFTHRNYFSVRPDTEQTNGLYNDIRNRRSNTFRMPNVQANTQHIGGYRANVDRPNANRSPLATVFTRDLNVPRTGSQRHRLPNNSYGQPQNYPTQTNHSHVSDVDHVAHAPSENVSRREFNAVLDALNALNHSIQNINSANRVNEVPVRTVSPPYHFEAPMHVLRTNHNAAHDYDEDIRSVRSDQFPTTFHRSGMRQSRQHSQQGLPIHKWNLHFTADKKSAIPEEKDLRAFFKKLDIFTEAEHVGYDEIYNRFHLLVKGNASEWYIQYRSKFRNWTELKAGLIKQYTTPLNKFMVTQRLARHRQGKYESASEFISRMTREFDSMCVYDEYEKIPVIQNGLREELRLRATSTLWNSVAEMNVFLSQMEIADELHALSSQDRSHKKEGVYQQKFVTRRSVNAIEAVGDCDSVVEEEEEGYTSENSQNSEEVELCAFNSKQSNFSKDPKRFHTKFDGRKKITAASGQKVVSGDKKRACFNCKSDAHLFRDCDKPVDRIFCFTCGEEGKLSPNCAHESVQSEPKNLEAVARSRHQQSEATTNGSK